MVSATAVERYVITMRPMKLQMAPMAMAASGLMERAPIAVAIALDASGCAVDKDSADDESRDDEKHGVRDQCADENAEADHELSPLPGVPGVRQRSATPGRTNPHILMLCGISHAVVASM